jgi:hypothetical protein
MDWRCIRVRLLALGVGWLAYRSVQGGEHGVPYSASIGNNLIPSITNFGSDVPIGGFPSAKDHDPESLCDQ